MIQIATYVFENGQYVPIEQSTGPAADPDYIKGAIEFEIAGVAIITKAEWDLVDQLWAYLVQAAVELAAGRSFTTRFPDQPVELAFTLAAGVVTVELRYPGLDRAALAVVDCRALVAAIASVGAHVFHRLLSFAPSNRDSYARVLRQLEPLRETDGVLPLER